MENPNHKVLILKHTSKQKKKEPKITHMQIKLDIKIYITKDKII